MRLRTVNHLTLVAVSLAMVTSLLCGSGCQPAQPAQPPTAMQAPMQPPAGPAPTLKPAIQSMTMPATSIATTMLSVPATQTTTEPVTPATTQLAIIQPASVRAASTQASITQATSEPATSPIADAPLPTDEQVIVSDLTLAERIAGMAELQFAAKVTDANAWPLIWKHQAALLSACNRLAPKEARFPRLMADAYVQLHDVRGEKQSLGAAIIAQQAHDGQPDEFIWDRDLDLHLADYQTATEKLDYLTGMIGAKEAVPANVRAHAGFRKAQILLDRGEDESANKTLAESLILSPASLECLTLRYSLLPADATRFERCGQLLDLLRANALQSQYSAQLADLVADSGLVQESLPWFNLAVGSLHLQGKLGAHSMLNMAAEMYIADQKPDALRLNSALLKADPTNTQAHLLQVVIARTLDDKDALAAAMQSAGNALTNRVIDAINAAAPPDAPKATTRPMDDPSPVTLPDLGLTVSQLNQGGKPEQKAQFAEALADLAMLEGYFGHQPEAAAKLVDAIKGVVPDDAPELARLRGWNELLSGKPDDAKAKFATVAAEDPLAELGMVKVGIASTDPREREQSESMGRRLIVDHSSGLLGAILWEELHSERVKLIPSTQAVALQTSLAAFPVELMSLQDKPQSIYSVHVQPYLVGSYVGEPLLATVSINNLSSHDLTIGPDGVLKPELLFKIIPEIGAKPPMFEAFDTIAGPTVLPGHSKFNQTVRLDQTQMLSFLGTQAGLAFEVSGTLATNEVARRLGGYQVQFTKTFYRQATPLSPATIETAMTNLTGGRADQKVTALSQVQMLIMELRAAKNPPAGLPQQISSMMEAIHRARTDTLPAVAAWACQCEAQLVAPAQRETVVRDMAEDPDWRHRQLAVLMLGGTSAATRRELLGKLASDPQGSIQADAAAVQGILSLPAPTTMPAATMPATAPATLPTTDPATMLPQTVQ